MTIGLSASEKRNREQYGFGRFSEYRDHLGYVIIYAPDRFPERDFLPPDGQMTLDSAFDELRRGLPVSFDRIKDKASIPTAEQMLEASYAAYKRGDERTGIFLLQEFDVTLLELRRGRPRKTDPA